MTHLISNNKSKIKLNKILEFAKEIGFELNLLVENEENEDKALLNAMQSTRTDEFVDMDLVKNRLKK